MNAWPSRPTVRWNAPGSSTHEITSSACSRSSRKRSVFSAGGFAMSIANPVVWSENSRVAWMLLEISSSWYGRSRTVLVTRRPRRPALPAIRRYSFEM